MKKILLVATSIVALSTVAGAGTESHNYIGGGLGWTVVRGNAKTADSSAIDLADNLNAQKGVKIGDEFVSGALFLGRKFVHGDSAWLIEAKAGKDLSDAKKDYTYSLPAGIFVAGPAAPYTTSVSLRRQYTLGLAVGYSKDVVKNISAYFKLSTLFSKFSLNYNTINYAAAPYEHYANTSKKSAFGVGATIGLAKKLQDFSVGLDYTFEMYQRIKQISAVQSQEFDGLMSHTSKITPQYHTVMLSVTKEI